MPEYSKTFTGSLTAPDGTVRYFINGALAREGDLPAVEYPDGSVVFYIENPKRGGFGQRTSVEHRVGGPALIRANGDQIYYQFGKTHRDPVEGPAVILHTGVKKWFVNGEFIRAERPPKPADNPPTYLPLPTMNPNATPAERIVALRTHVSHLAHAYYVLDAPRVTDGEYDALYRELEQLEAQHPELVTADSPTQRVGGVPLKEFPSVTHRTPMLSLANAMDEAEARRFAQSCADALGIDIEAVEYSCEDKYDGLAITLTYDDGLLVRAATRGDGETGEEVTAQARTVKSIPLRLPKPLTIEIRGEMMMLNADFATVNEELVAAGKAPLVNPRNGAAGAIRQLDPKVTASRRLSFFAYGMNGAEDHAFTNQVSILDFLKDLGFRVSPNVKRVTGFEGIKAAFAEMSAKRKTLGWGIDGVVFKVSDIAQQEQISWSSRVPKWAVAYKFPPEEMPTELLAIDIQVGRTGAVTPVARLKPVFVGGVTVTNVTLHNLGQVGLKDVRVGDTVIVRRAGDVIPEITGPLLERRPKDAAPWEMPANCPECGSPLHPIGAEHFCSGGSRCPAQRLYRLTHFSSRLAMDIEGLGESSLATLLNEGFITQASDLYSLDTERLAARPGFGEQSAANLAAAIAGTRGRPLPKFLFSLGILGVGEATAKDLARAFGTWEAFASATREELLAVPDVGEVTAESILEFLQSPDTADEAHRLARLIMPQAVDRASAGKLTGKTLVLTGTFPTLILGGRALPSMAGHKRDCTTSWKTEPLSRLRKRLLGRNKPAAGQFVASVTGVRRSESPIRAGNLMKRAEAADRLVQTNADGNVAIAPIIEWSYDDVFTYLGMCSNGLEETYSDFSRVIEIYREATGECVIAGSDSNRTAAACGSRTGCFTCLAVKNDRSMDQMVKEPHNAFMRPLAAFRRFLANTFHDLSRRTWVGRTIDENGYIRFAVDGYSPAMLQELLRYALTIDIEEREAAARLGVEPRFQIVSMEALLAISAHWSLQGFALPYTALAIYRQIERGARHPVPEVPEAPKASIPPARYIHVGRGWDEGHAFMYTGLRDVMIDAFGGSGCIGQREIITKGERRTIMDVANSDMFSIDAEGAALFMQFELDRVVDEWHGPGARRWLSIEGHHVAGIEYRHYVSYGFLSVAKGQEGKVDEILRRTAWRERLGLAGYQYDHQRALAMSVEAPVPVVPSQHEALANQRAAIEARREAKRRLVRQQRLSLTDLQRDWAPDVSWQRLVQQGMLKMPAIPRAKNGRLVLRHLISRYALLSFLQENPLVMQRVRHFRTRRSPSAARDPFGIAA